MVIAAALLKIICAMKQPKIAEPTGHWPAEQIERWPTTRMHWPLKRVATASGWRAGRVSVASRHTFSIPRVSRYRGNLAGRKPTGSTPSC